jgi:hypothetical protein
MFSHKNDEGKPFVVSQALEPHELRPATYATMRQGFKQRLQTFTTYTRVRDGL